MQPVDPTDLEATYAMILESMLKESGEISQEAYVTVKIEVHEPISAEAASKIRWGMKDEKIE